jgi:general secretion pathway protein G
MMTPTLHRRMKRSPVARGMTLIEIMVVLTLIGLVMTVLAANFFGLAETQKVKTTGIQMETLKGRLDAYKLEYGRYPSSSEGLNALVSPPPKRNGMTPGAFLDDGALLADPWGTPLQYYQPGRDGQHKFEIVSLGSDGVPGGEGTDADFSNWQLTQVNN